MATAHKTTKTVTQEVTTYTLELSEEERGALGRYLMGCPNGSLFAVRRALISSDQETTTPAPLAVGDRVRVTELNHEYTGRVGTLVGIDQADEVLPHMVEFDDGDCWWTKGVERA